MSRDAGEEAAVANHAGEFCAQVVPADREVFAPEADQAAAFDRSERRARRA